MPPGSVFTVYGFRFPIALECSPRLLNAGHAQPTRRKHVTLWKHSFFSMKRETQESITTRT
jgi:hypothetical protein